MENIWSVQQMPRKEVVVLAKAVGGQEIDCKHVHRIDSESTTHRTC